MERDHHAAPLAGEAGRRQVDVAGAGHEGIGAVGAQCILVECAQHAARLGHRVRRLAEHLGEDLAGRIEAAVAEIRRDRFVAVVASGGHRQVVRERALAIVMHLHAFEARHAVAQLFVEMRAGFGHRRCHQRVGAAVQQVDMGAREILQRADLAGGGTLFSTGHQRRDIRCRHTLHATAERSIQLAAGAAERTASDQCRVRKQFRIRQLCLRRHVCARGQADHGSARRIDLEFGQARTGVFRAGGAGAGQQGQP